jgi:hypothetical protein
MLLFIGDREVAAEQQELPLYTEASPKHRMLLEKSLLTKRKEELFSNFPSRFQSMPVDGCMLGISLAQ